MELNFQPLCVHILVEKVFFPASCTAQFGIVKNRKGDFLF